MVNFKLFISIRLICIIIMRPFIIKKVVAFLEYKIHINKSRQSNLIWSESGEYIFYFSNDKQK